MRESNGDILAFTDADCAPERDWLTQIERALARPDRAVAVGSHRPARPSRILSLIATHGNETYRYIYGAGDPSLYYAHTNNMAVRRELFAELGAFVERDRGADTILVRRAVERVGAQAVQFVPEVAVRHLEMNGTATYYRKAFVYGRARKQYRALAAVRGLSLRQKLLVLGRTSAAERLSPPGFLLLLALLAGALLCHNVGYAVAGPVRR